MLHRSVKISIRLILLMLMGIGLAVSTLHSHHNLELHNSADFADTGQCLTEDSTMCPICAHLVQLDNNSGLGVSTFFVDVDSIVLDRSSYLPSPFQSYHKGRSPPSGA